MLQAKFILGLIVYVVCIVVMGACHSPNVPDVPDVSVYNQIASCVEEAANDLNRGNVYFNNNQYEEARKCNVDAQLHLSDAKVLLNNAQLTEVEQNDARLAISCGSESLIGLNEFVDAAEIMFTSDDWLTWGPYHNYINSIVAGRDRLLKAQEIAARVSDDRLIGDFDVINKLIPNYNELLDEIQNEQVLAAVKIYTYITKVDAESVRDKAIEIIRDSTDEKGEITAIFYYVRDNIKYVKDPRYNELDFDYIQSPSQTLNRNAGDCDDLSILLASLLESVGHSTKLCFVDTDGKEPFEFNHMNIIVSIKEKDYYILETTCKTCKIGEYFGEMYYESYDYAEFQEKMREAMSQARKAMSQANN